MQFLSELHFLFKEYVLFLKVIAMLFRSCFTL